MKKIGYSQDRKKVYQIRQLLSELISNLKSNSSSFDDFIQNLSNKHQQFVFGWFYQEGIGVEENREEHLRLMKLSSDQGHVLAEYEIGRYYRGGDGVEENKELGFEYFMRSATKDCSVAQYNVGVCYECGIGASKDESLAFEWFKKSAENGSLYVCYNLGRRYLVGIGTEVNEEEGLRWLQLSAEKRNDKGLSQMGELYFYGRIVERDRNKSIEFLEKAVALQWYNDDAKYILGVHYLQDERDPSNQTKGFQFLGEIQYSVVNAKHFNIIVRVVIFHSSITILEHVWKKELELK